jgi:hypothetical protein
MLTQRPKESRGLGKKSCEMQESFRFHKKRSRSSEKTCYYREHALSMSYIWPLSFSAFFINYLYYFNPVPGGITGPPCYKYADLAFHFGDVSSFETIEYVLGSYGIQTRAGLRWRGPAATVNYRPVLSSERALQNNKLSTGKIKFQGQRKICRGSQTGAWHQDGLDDWLSVVI